MLQAAVKFCMFTYQKCVKNISRTLKKLIFQVIYNLGWEVLQVYPPKVRQKRFLKVQNVNFQIDKLYKFNWLIKVILAFLDVIEVR